MISCPECNFENSLANEKCSRCGCFLGFPNVNECSTTKEVSALDKRYREQIDQAKKVNQEPKITDFEIKMGDSAAVMNVDIEYLHAFILKDNALYTNYQLGTRGEVRDFAREDFDKERLGVEGTLFGSYGVNIRYAALSLDGTGLKSYGQFTIILDEIAIKKRATILEENSYQFIRRHKILAGGKIPAGYRSVWEARGKLAVAKLGREVLLTNSNDYGKIIISDTGNKKRDVFIEVHIYGKLNKESILAVRGSSKNVPDQGMLQRIKDYLDGSKKHWYEE